MTMTLTPAQQSACAALAAWLATDEHVAVLTGDRRCGKSFAAVHFACEQARDPSRQVALVSEEVLRFDKAPPPNVAICSPRHMEKLKHGGFDLVVLVQAETMPAAVMVHALNATRETEGRVLLTANPPKTAVGEWTISLVAALRAGTASGRVIAMSSRVPTGVDPERAARFAKLIAIIDPEANRP